MNRIHLISLLAVSVLLVSLSSVQISNSELYYKMLVKVHPAKDPIIEGEYPLIVGNVTDEAYKPVSDARVLILFGNEAVTTTTDDRGAFKYQSAIPSTPGTYEIDVTVTKKGYVNSLATSTYTVNPYPQSTEYNTTSPTAAAVRTSVVNGLPVYAENYTVFLGKVAKWNLETTCFVDFADKYMRFLHTCDLYKMAPEDFKSDQDVIPMVSVVQYNNTYRLFPESVYLKAYFMENSTMNDFVAGAWSNYTSPQ